MSHERHSPLIQKRHDVALWTGLFAGPVAWIVQFLLIYILAPQVCGNVIKDFVLHLPALLCLLTAIAGAVLAWRNWRTAGRSWPSERDPPDVTRIRFLSLLGVMTASLFALVIAAQWLSILFLPPCPP